MVDPFMQTAIPFLFVFAITFGVLEIALKKWSIPVKAIIALSLSFFTIAYAPFQNLIWSNLGNVALFFIIMFFLAFVIEIIGMKKVTPANAAEKMVSTAVVLLILLSIGWMMVDTISFDIPIIGGPDDFFLLIGILVIVAIFSAAFKSSGAYISVLQEQQKEQKQG